MAFQKPLDSLCSTYNDILIQYYIIMGIIMVDSGSLVHEIWPAQWNQAEGTLKALGACCMCTHGGWAALSSTCYTCGALELSN